MHPRRKSINCPKVSPPNYGARELVSHVPRRSSDGHLQGAALVIVLAFLVIITGLVVAFLSSVTNEATATSASAAGVTTRSLADAAIQLDIAQIRDATVGFSHNADGSLNTASPVAWASQPGAIRTYDTNAAAVSVYKLYSSTNMVSSGAQSPTNDLPTSASWVSNTALYTDLNAPVVSGGNTNYPIMDPYMTNTTNGCTIVDGFSISNAPLLSGLPNPAAMPVVWIYVLKDGTLIKPDSGGGTTATFASASTNPSSVNPIVGRIAFWTDDETCKLNINTASEGSFWGTPSFATAEDLAFAIYPPSSSEFSRFPGHPASTCLSPVLWTYIGLTNPALFLGGMPGSASYGANSGSSPSPTISSTISSYFGNLFTNVTPRYVWDNTSKSGTYSLVNNALTPYYQTNRLYANVDDFFFAATNSTMTNRARNSYSGVTGLTPLNVAQLRFFLTAASRSPEVNPMNLPKITIWPVPSTNKMTANTSSTAGATRTLIDQTIAFCSTLGGKAYYFDRFDATSQTADFTARNATVYNYMRNLLNQPVPGFKGVFAKNAGKWSGNQANQITTEIYDYIRSCINLVDASSLTNSTPTTLAGNFNYSYTVPPVISGAGITLTNGTGQVMPISINNPDGSTSKGMGRFPTMRSAALWFVARAANQPPLICHPDGRPIVYDASGNQISVGGSPSYIPTNTSLTVTNFSTIPPTVSTVSYPRGAWLDVVCAGTARAKINLMHPWTIPPTNNLVVGGDYFMPQLMNGVYAVIAKGSLTSNSILNTDANITKPYPIFDLSGTNSPGTSQTPTYPTYSSSDALITNYSSGNILKICTNNLLTFKGTNYYATNNSVGSLYYTHPGMPYATVQDYVSGSFTLENTTYWDAATGVLVPQQTRMEVAYLPDFVNIAPGSVAIKPKFSLTVTGLSSDQVAGVGIDLVTNKMSFLNNTDNNQFFLLYGIGIQLAMLSDTGKLPLYSTNSLFKVTGETFSFGGGNTITNTIAGPSGDTVQTICVNFPSATFPTPKLQVYRPTYGFNSYNPPHDHTNLFTNSLLSFTKSKGNSFAPDYQQLGLFSPEMGLGQSSTDPGWGWYTAGLNHITADTIQSVDLIFGDPRISAMLANIPTSLFAANPAYGQSSRITIKNSTTGNGWPTYLRNAHSLRCGQFVTDGGLYGTLLATNNGVQWVNDFKWPPLCEGSTIPTLGTNSLIGPIFSSAPLLTGATNMLGVKVPTVSGTGYGNFFSWVPNRGATYYSSINNGHTALPYTGSDCDFTSTNAGSFYAMWTKGGDFDNGLAWYPDGPFINKADEGSGAYGGMTGSASPVKAPYFATFNAMTGVALFNANRMVPSPVMFGSLPVFDSSWDPANPLSTLTQSSWRTLQFSPNPNALTNSMCDARSVAAGYNEAGGIITNAIPPDHLLLDFFQMPVVSPYPISDPFSTAGKVNMNYQIAPFNYITRSTALRGVFKPVMITAVDDQWSINYKNNNLGDMSDNNSYQWNDTVGSRAASGAPSYNAFGLNSGYFYFHYPIYAPYTLTQFAARFAQNDLFHSPSEICALWLYPSQQPKGGGEEASPLTTDANGINWVWDTSDNNSIKNWWYKNSGTTRKALTGDNIRERPYNYLYPRLTTKSNTYQIHYRVQTLKQTPTAHSSNWTTWIDPSAGGISDKILGEQRGSAVIERFIDPSDPSIPDFTANVSQSSITGPTLDQFYRFRVFNAKQFTP